MITGCSRLTLNVFVLGVTLLIMQESAFAQKRATGVASGRFRIAAPLTIDSDLLPIDPTDFTVSPSSALSLDEGDLGLSGLTDAGMAKAAAKDGKVVLRYSRVKSPSGAGKQPAVEPVMLMAVMTNN